MKIGNMSAAAARSGLLEALLSKESMHSLGRAASRCTHKAAAKEPTTTSQRYSGRAAMVTASQLQLLRCTGGSGPV